jgi:DNA repair exonuclease SbcCD ATPase subunit
VGRQVGIISHREEIRESIPVQISVQSKAGSSESVVEVIDK